MQVQHPLAVVTPTLDGGVLAALALADAAFTVGQLHRLMPGRSPEGVRKTLQRLAAQGIVDREIVGRTAQYRLNREHLAAEPIISLASQRATLLQRLQDHIETWQIRPVYGTVFGSTMRGTMRLDSDIDIFLVRPDGADPDAWDVQTHPLALQVTRWTGNDARVLSMTESEVRAGAGTDPVLASIAEAMAGTVAGDRDWMRQIMRGKARDRDATDR